MHPDMLEKHFKIFYWGGLLLGLVLALIYSSNQILMGDQTQMLDKGVLGATQGVWLGYGNAASVVGNVPGSLSALVIGLPLMVWDSPYAPILFLLFLHGVAFFLFDAVIKKVYSKKIRLVFIAVFWLNPWFLFESTLYNPSYLFFASALHLWSAFHMRSKKSFGYSFVHLLSIGIALQFHYSWVILAGLSTYLFYRKMILIHWMGLITAGLTVLASLYPYILTLIENSGIAKNANETDRYIGWAGVHVYPVLKALVYWVRYTSLLFTHKLVFGAGFDWVSSTLWVQTVALYIWRAVVIGLGVASLWFVWKMNKLFYFQVKGHILRADDRERMSTEQWLMLYVVGATVAIFISAVMSPIVFSYWHLIIAFPFALMIVLSWAQQYQEKVIFVKGLAAIVLYFTVINLFASHDSIKYSYKVDVAQQYEKIYKGKKD